MLIGVSCEKYFFKCQRITIVMLFSFLFKFLKAKILGRDGSAMNLNQ